MKLYDEIAAELTTDGDSYALPDGAVVRLRITADDVDPFDWSDCWGKVAPVEPDRYTIYRRTRPAGFDGNAEILDARDGRYWWQPPAGVNRSDRDAWRTLRQRVGDLMEFGLYVVTVELCRGYDAYGRLIVVDVASLSAVELWADRASAAYLAEVIGDLLSQLEITNTETEIAA